MSRVRSVAVTALLHYGCQAVPAPAPEVTVQVVDRRVEVNWQQEASSPYSEVEIELRQQNGREGGFSGRHEHLERIRAAEGGWTSPTIEQGRWALKATFLSPSGTLGIGREPSFDLFVPPAPLRAPEDLGLARPIPLSILYVLPGLWVEDERAEDARKVLAAAGVVEPGDADGADSFGKTFSSMTDQVLGIAFEHRARARPAQGRTVWEDVQSCLLALTSEAGMTIPQVLDLRALVVVDLVLPASAQPSASRAEGRTEATWLRVRMFDLSCLSDPRTSRGAPTAAEDIRYFPLSFRRALVFEEFEELGEIGSSAMLETSLIAAWSRILDGLCLSGRVNEFLSRQSGGRRLSPREDGVLLGSIRPTEEIGGTQVSDFHDRLEREVLFTASVHEIEMPDAEGEERAAHGEDDEDPEAAPARPHAEPAPETEGAPENENGLPQAGSEDGSE